jgi:hypothetical protein
VLSGTLTRGRSRDGENTHRANDHVWMTAPVVLPDQFYASPYVSYAKRPEASLMRAVLEDAFTCFQYYFRYSSKRYLRLAQEAEEWFASDDTQWPFAFVNVCKTLGLNPAYIRQGIKQWHTAQLKERQHRKQRIVRTEELFNLGRHSRIKPPRKDHP